LNVASLDETAGEDFLSVYARRETISITGSGGEDESVIEEGE
jgi:hypothetical protein